MATTTAGRHCAECHRPGGTSLVYIDVEGKTQRDYFHAPHCFERFRAKIRLAARALTNQKGGA